MNLICQKHGHQGALLYMYLRKKRIVRIENELAEMVIRWSSTNRAKTNLIRQKTWPPGAWPVSLMNLCERLSNIYSETSDQKLKII